MSTLFDAGLPAEQPQVHALVVGVSSYPHLPGGDRHEESPASRDFGLQQLTSPAVSAAAVADWLLGEHNNPATLLGSVELLLSPASYTPSTPKAAGRLGGVPGTVRPVPEARLAAIRQAAARWFLRLNRNRDNIAFFYFCGHGLEASDRYLLPADYGSNPLDWAEHIINFTATYNNLDRCRAKSQCFFLDACRDHPEELQKLAARNPVGQALIGPQSGSLLDRDAPIYHAAVPGRSAAGPPGQKSYFTRALLDCLGGMGARQPSDTEAPVDLVSLSSAMRELVDRLAEESELPLRCNVTSDLQLPVPADLHVAPMPVNVLTIISCEPRNAHSVAQLKLKDSAGKEESRPTPGEKPWRLTVPAGTCVVQATFNPQQPFSDFDAEVIAHPPVFKPLIRIAARAAGGGVP
jgi:hypothetical protein